MKIYKPGEMLTCLDEVVTMLPALLGDRSIWRSMIVNRRKPHTYRVFTNLNDSDMMVRKGMRVCLHKFNPCDTHESFAHPHPWPGAFLILSGSYKMMLGYSVGGPQDENYVEVANTTLHKFSSYEIVNPLTWHSVTPLETTYTVMINDEPWPVGTAHKEVRTTKGKDLEELSLEELQDHLNIFQTLVKEWLEQK